MARDDFKPSTYDIYCREDGRWQLHSCFLNEEADEALAEAKRLDSEGGFEGIRLMHTKYGGSARGPLEVMVWVSPRLEREMFKPKAPRPKPAVVPAKDKERKPEPVPAAAPAEVPQPARPGPTPQRPRRRPASQPPGPPAAQPVEADRRALEAFVRRASGVVGGDEAARDAFTVFGIALFVAGACLEYGRRHGLDAARTAALMRHAVAFAGAPADRAESFDRRLDEYRGNPKYAAMVTCGERVMAAVEDGGARPFTELAAILGSWGVRPAETAADGVVTLLFTDIVGSTRLTQERGDRAAQEVLHAHNAIVRESLAAFGGREVKHTGDGIMASFPRATGAIDAARRIQAATARHAAGTPDSAFQVRIGLNAGEPVSEAGDFFGTAVQLAARVCDKAGAGQILVTEAVRGLAAGHGHRFQGIGQVALKGIEEAVPLFEVAWDETA